MPRENIKKILIVDDDKDICHFTKSYFERKGYAVFTAGSTLEALRILTEEDPQILLLDNLISSRKGADLLAEIRKFNSRVCVIMISTEELDSGTRSQIADLNVLEFMEKPVSFSKLEKAINNAWNKYVSRLGG